MTEFSLAQWRESSQAEIRFPDTPGKGRDLVDAFATVAWIRTAVSLSRGSLTALNARLSKSMGDDPSGHLQGYMLGRHWPSLTKVAAVEAIAPSSAAVLEHLLWSVLRVREPALRAWDSWLSRVSPVDLRRVQDYVSTGKLHARDRRSLQGRNTPEALAVMIALLRRDVEIGCIERAAQWTAPILRTLVEVRPALENWGCAYAVEQYLGEVIFEQISALGGLAYTYHGHGFASVTCQLQYLRDHQRAGRPLKSDRWADHHEALQVSVIAELAMDAFLAHLEGASRVGEARAHSPHRAVCMWVQMGIWAIAGRRYRLASLPWNGAASKRSLVPPPGAVPICVNNFTANAFPICRND